jgi:hypothetical protein
MVTFAGRWCDGPGRNYVPDPGQKVTICVSADNVMQAVTKKPDRRIKK